MPGRVLALLAAAALVLIVSALFIQRALSPGPVLELDEAGYVQAESAFARLAGGLSQKPPAGFTAHTVDTPFRGLAVDEPEGRCHGGGTYLLRSGAAVLPLLVTAPHRGADRYTGPLVMALMAEGRAAAAGWNSVPRRSNCSSGTSDLARIERHPFTALSAGFARAHPNGRVVQVHGFDRHRRTTPEGQAASIILSSGSTRVSPAVGTVAECLRDSLPAERVAVFPTDVSELGALRNAQGRRLRAIGFDGFVHVELSLSLRERLMSDVALRRRFGACLEAGL